MKSMLVGLTNAHGGYRHDWVDYQVTFDQLLDHHEESVVRESWVQNAYRMNPGRLDGSGVVVDIGACFGAFSLLALKLGARRLHAYEPGTENMQRFVHHLNLNDLADDRVTLFREGVGGCFGTYTMAGEGVVGYAVPDAHGTGVMVSLDSVIDRAGRDVDVLKIDCEGCEYPAILRAQPETLAAIRFMAVEWHNTPNTVRGQNAPVEVPEQIGEVVHQLLWTHHVEVSGLPDVGGMLYATRR